MTTEKTKKNEKKYKCINCHFFTSKKTDYSIHLTTLKHINNGLTTENNRKNDKNENHKLECLMCDRTFNDRAGLWRHKKKCETNYCNEDFITCINDVTKQEKLIEYLLKENSEFKQLMIDQNKQLLEIAKNSGNNNTTNNFNINFFLNETCKNAMNIMDFVSQLQVGIKELEDTGRLGFAEGISNIFINGLKKMDISDRPIHCSDLKRETMYIKDKDQWSKEKTVLTTAIKHVAHKNMKQISEWSKVHPEYNDSMSKQNDKYLKIVSESMCGSTKEESYKNYTKIISNVAKQVIIHKHII